MNVRGDQAPANRQKMLKIFENSSTKTIPEQSYWVLVEGNECSGRPSTSKPTGNVEKIRKLIHKDHPRAIREFADTVGISYGVCKEILTDNLNMICNTVNYVPWLLTNDQKQRHMNICLELREKANEDPTFISRITFFRKLKIKLNGRL
jgi:hypothetical protein